jgi:homoserine trans-succinylase
MPIKIPNKLPAVEVLNKENLMKSSGEEDSEADWINRMQAILKDKKGE